MSKWGVPGRERTLAVSPFGYAEGRRLVAAPSLARHCFLCGGHRWVAPAQSWVVGEGVLERASPATGISLRKAGLSGCTLHPEASLGGHCLLKLQAIQPTEHRGFQTYFIEEEAVGHTGPQGSHQDGTSAPLRRAGNTPKAKWIRRLKSVIGQAQRGRSTTSRWGTLRSCETSHSWPVRRGTEQ